MCAETAIAKYTLIFSVPAGVAAVLKAVLGVLRISKRVGGAAVERMPLRLRISLQVGVLGEGRSLKGGRYGYEAMRISVISVLLKYRYHTFLVGVLARLLAEANCACFLR